MQRARSCVHIHTSTHCLDNIRLSSYLVIYCVYARHTPMHGHTARHAQSVNNLSTSNIIVLLIKHWEELWYTLDWYWIDSQLPCFHFIRSAHSGHMAGMRTSARNAREAFRSADAMKDTMQLHAGWIFTNKSLPLMSNSIINVCCRLRPISPDNVQHTACHWLHHVDDVCLLLLEPIGRGWGLWFYENHWYQLICVR